MKNSNCPMFRSILITVVLLARIMSCTDSAFKEDATSKTPTSKGYQQSILQTIFRFSRNFKMFFDANGIPYQYHVPRVELRLEDLNNGRVKIPMRVYCPYKRGRVPALGENKLIGENDSINRKRMNSSYNFCWRLAATTRALTALEQKSAHLWRRDSVPLNRLMLSLESPIFLGYFFYALTSLTEANGSSILSRFYYAPVLTARCGRKHSGSDDLTVKDIELNVFSICLESSNAPEDEASLLMHRPQRIIDVGVRSSKQNIDYDVKEKLRVNSTAKLNEAEKQFANTKWNTLFSDSAMMAFRRFPAENSPYAKIKTPFGDYHKDYLAFLGPTLTAFHGHDFQNDAYVFANGFGNRYNFFYGTDDIKLLIFLNPETHFKDKNKLWDMCVDLWKQEMRARHGTDANSRLIHPHAYLNKNASTAPYYEMLPRYDALGTPQERDMVPLRRVSQPRKRDRPKMLPHQKKSSKRTAVDMLSGLESSETPSVPETIKDSVELDNSKTLERCSPTNVVPEANGLAKPWSCFTMKSADEQTSAASVLESGSILLDSSAGSSSNPNMLESGATSDGTSYAYAPEFCAGELLPSASSSSIDACLNELLLEPAATDWWSVDIDWESGWLPSPEPNNAAVYKGTETRNELLSAGTEYANLLSAESAYSNPLTGYLPPGPDSDEIGAEPLAEIQQIDGPTLDRMHRIIQDAFNEPYLE